MAPSKPRIETKESGSPLSGPQAQLTLPPIPDLPTTVVKRGNEYDRAMSENVVQTADCFNCITSSGSLVTEAVYIIDTTAAGPYEIQIEFASAEARPISIFVNNNLVTGGGTGAQSLPADVILLVRLSESSRSKSGVVLSSVDRHRC